MKDFMDNKDNISININQEEAYRLWNITIALSSITKNISPELIENFAYQELMEQKKKRDDIDKQFQNQRLKIISESDFFLILSNRVDIQVHIHKWNIGIIRNMHDTS